MWFEEKTYRGVATHIEPFAHTAGVCGVKNVPEREEYGL